ncbi:TolC family protein [Sunxiuqinia indica]|uniref:TolC family protein n=1 Tax=Sunxiuqinia indica TaxID=2692584 RepID=UPI00135761DB|nr:TolC family protein [Sunxiuqinia indica]
MKSKYLLSILVTVLIGLSTKGQDKQLKLSLEDVIELASSQSLDAFRNENMFRASYWEFRYFKADRLPSLSLDATPLDFNRYRNREYNFQTNEEEYVQREYLNADFGLSLNQNVALTGGRLFLRSELGMVKNLNGDKNNSYQSTPISIGYQQELNGYNRLRWEAKIEPLKYEKAKKVFIESREDLSIKATRRFFNLVSAEINLSIAENNKASADTLYKIGQGRFQVGTVTQDELLNLQLSQLRAEQALNTTKLGLLRAQAELNSFLGLDKNTKVSCIVPSEIPKLEVKAGEAIAQALDNNPEILNQQQQLLQEDRQVAEAKSEIGLNTSIYALYGLDQSAKELENVYDNPDRSQRFRLGVNIPIVDWGRRKGRYQMAEYSREVVKATVRQARIDFEQDIVQTVMEFNLQGDQVRNAALADTVAQKGFEVTFQRFLIGKVDVINLNQARNDLEQARKDYVLALNAYWNYYYSIRRLTLYDFAKDEPLTEEYDEILKN